MSITAKDLISVCLELDQQVISPRPSHGGEMALLVATLCDHAEGSLRDDRLGDWRCVDLSSARKRPNGKLNQPTLDALERNSMTISFDRPATRKIELLATAMGVDIDGPEWSKNAKTMMTVLVDAELGKFRAPRPEDGPGMPPKQQEATK